jgi:uncharacterized membrane protein
LAATLALSTPGVAAERYDVFKLGTHVLALGINEHNEVVGIIQPESSPFTWYAFYWRQQTGLVSIGGSQAHCINERGQVAGKSALLRAAVWEHGIWIELPRRQEAWAINDHGQVTGLISAQPDIPGPYAPYRDDDIDSPDFIELERPWPYASHGFDINNRGEVVADCGGAPGGLYGAVFYGADASYVVLDSDGNYDAHARSINDAGQIVGNTMVTFSSDHQAVFWESYDSPMEYMGTLGPGAGVARAINNLGQAVGNSGGAAFLWTAEEGMLNLNDLIDPEHEIELTMALDINDRGVIVSVGLDPAGQEGSYLLTPRVGHGAASSDSAPRRGGRN